MRIYSMLSSNLWRVIQIFIQNQRDKGRAAPLTCHTVSRNTHIKVIHTKLDVT